MNKSVDSLIQTKPNNNYSLLAFPDTNLLIIYQSDKFQWRNLNHKLRVPFPPSISCPLRRCNIPQDYFCCFAQRGWLPFQRSGLTHEITIERGQSSQGAYAEDRGICVLAVDIPSLYLLLRRGEYTRVYTTVYLRVHNCIPTCTQPCSKYVPRIALVYSSPRSYRHSRDTSKAP
nr:MAG TPA: hypothetical protein [Caudoviricetes sp.]